MKLKDNGPNKLLTLLTKVLNKMISINIFLNWEIIGKINLLTLDDLNILKHNSLVAHNPYSNKCFLTKTKNKYMYNTRLHYNKLSMKMLQKQKKKIYII